MPQTIFTITNQRLEPAAYPADARTANGKFGASTVFQTGQAIGVKTSDKLLYPCVTPNAVQLITMVTAATAGTFTISVLRPTGVIGTTTALAYGATVAQIQTALDIASGVVNGVVATATGGSSVTPFVTVLPITLTYSGTGYAALAQPLATVVWSAGGNGLIGLTGTTSVTVTNVQPNQVQTVTVASVLTAGHFEVKVVRPNGTVGSTGAVAYNANLATFQTALDLASGGTNYIVATSAGSAAPFQSATAAVLTFSGTGYAGITSPLAQFFLDSDVTFTSTVGATVVDTTISADGTEKCVGFVEYGFQTDASSLCYLSTVSAAADLITAGSATMSYYIAGTFKTADIVGWKDSMVTDLAGRLLAGGTLVRVP